MNRRIAFLNNQGLASAGGGVTILRQLVLDLVRDHDVTVLSFDAPTPGFESVRRLRVRLLNGCAHTVAGGLARA